MIVLNISQKKYNSYRIIIVLLIWISAFNVKLIDAVNNIIVSDETSTNDWTDVKNFIVSYNDTYIWFRIEYQSDIPDGNCVRYVRIYLDTDLDGKSDFWIDPELWVHSDRSYYIPGKTYSIHNKSFYELGVKLEDIGSPTAIGLPHIVLCSMVYDYLQRLTYTISNEKSIKIDGKFDDWEGIEPKLRDPSGDSCLSYIDITNIYVTSNGSSLFLRIDFSKPPYIYTSSEERGIRLRLMVSVNSHIFMALFWIRNSEIWSKDFFTPQGVEWSSSPHIAIDDCIEIAIPLSEINTKEGDYVNLQLEFSADVEDYVEEGQVIPFKFALLKLEVVNINEVGVPANVTIKENYSHKKSVVARIKLNDSGMAQLLLPINHYIIDAEFDGVHGSATILPKDLLSGTSVRIMLPLVGPPFIPIQSLLALIIAFLCVSLTATIYLVKRKSGRQAAPSPVVLANVEVEKEILKYDKYLEKLEQLKNEGKVSKQIYEKLKKEYEKKIEELIEKWHAR